MCSICKSVLLNGLYYDILITLTGIVLCCHCCACIVQNANSNNRDVVGTSRLEIAQQVPAVLCSQKGVVDGKHSENVKIIVHASWILPGKVDGIHCLTVHCDGARRVGN